MERSVIFHDRRHAGQVLAVHVLEYAHGDNVLALPRVDVPVGYEVARRLGVPLDVFVCASWAFPVPRNWRWVRLPTAEYACSTTNALQQAKPWNCSDASRATADCGPSARSQARRSCWWMTALPSGRPCVRRSSRCVRTTLRGPWLPLRSLLPIPVQRCVPRRMR